MKEKEKSRLDLDIEEMSPAREDTTLDVRQENADPFEDVSLDSAKPQRRRTTSAEWADPGQIRRRKQEALDERSRNRWRKEDRERLYHTNHEIRFSAIVIVALFLLLIGYTGYFMVSKADIYRNNSYNAKRQALLAEKYTRGSILASDGTVLATSVSEDGTVGARKYPQGSVYAHVVGYSVNGIAGLESSAASYLLDSHENLITQVMAEVQGNQVIGDSIRTTLNTGLQKLAYDALGSNRGAIVVMEPSTGKVLAMVSKPDFDPNDMKSPEEMDEGTLVNRATQGLYAPGSTFKILTALEFMRENPNSWEDYRYDCDGIMKTDGYTIQCYDQTVHGYINLKEAFMESCNGAFADIGTALNFRKFKSLCEEMGFNSSLGSGLGVAKSSFVLNNSNSLWNVLQTSIGQGETQVTPILNCMIAAAVANKGVMMKPMLVDSVENASGTPVRAIDPSEYDTVMSEEEAEVLADMMAGVCYSGTGTAAKGDGYTAYGKTGSAETSKKNKTNAWFVGYAEGEIDGEDCQLAVSIIVEEAGSGGSAAAPIAGKLFRQYFGS